MLCCARLLYHFFLFIISPDPFHRPSKIIPFCDLHFLLELWRTSDQGRVKPSIAFPLNVQPLSHLPSCFVHLGPESSLLSSNKSIYEFWNDKDVFKFVFFIQQFLLCCVCVCVCRCYGTQWVSADNLGCPSSPSILFNVESLVQCYISQTSCKPMCLLLSSLW